MTDPNMEALIRDYHEHGCWCCDQGYEDEECTCWFIDWFREYEKKKQEAARGVAELRRA